MVSSILTATTRGTRPGDPLADVLWHSLLYLRAVSNKLHSAGLQPFLPCPARSPSLKGSSDAPRPRCTLMS